MNDPALTKEGFAVFQSRTTGSNTHILSASGPVLPDNRHAKEPVPEDVWALVVCGCIMPTAAGAMAATSKFECQTPYYDVERFGIKLVSSPRHADVMLYQGGDAFTAKALQRAYEAMPAPKLVFAIGSCACDAASGLTLFRAGAG